MARGARSGCQARNLREGQPPIVRSDCGRARPNAGTAPPVRGGGRCTAPQIVGAAMSRVSASGYDDSRSFQPQPGPEFVFEIEVLTGEEGRQLRLEQARAIRDLLLWVRSQRRAGRAENS